MTGGVHGLADRDEVEAPWRTCRRGRDRRSPALRGVDIADAEWIALGKTDQYGGTLVIGVGEWGAEGPGAEGD